MPENQRIRFPLPKPGMVEGGVFGEVPTGEGEWCGCRGAIRRVSADFEETRLSLKRLGESLSSSAGFGRGFRESGSRAAVPPRRVHCEGGSFSRPGKPCPPGRACQWRSGRPAGGLPAASTVAAAMSEVGVFAVSAVP